MARKLPSEIEVEISQLGSDGFGKAVYRTVDQGAVAARGTTNPRTQDSVERELRVKNALPGERVAAKVLKHRRGQWLAEARKVTANRSAIRIAASCAYFPRCGGCAMQHLRYDQQLLLKQHKLERALSDSGVTPMSWQPPAHGPRFHYRTKARLGVKVVADQLLVGFRESFSSRVGRMDDCQTLIPAFSSLLPDLKRMLSMLSIPRLIPQIEVAAGDSDRALIVRHLADLSDADKSILVEFAHRHDVLLFSQGAGYDTIVPLNLNTSRTTNSSYLGYANPDFGLYFQFLPWEFTQVNLPMNRQLVRAALLALAVVPGASVVDLFCGIGNFSLALAAAGAQVRGLEMSRSAIERASMNAELNGLSERCEFLEADLYDPACSPLEDARYLLLDPPRSGAGVNLGRWLDQNRPERVVYVSCEPSSFAADAARCQTHGYALQQVGIYDMFPHTTHIETLGLFVRLEPQS